MTHASRLTESLTRAAMTGSAFCEATGVHPSTLSRWRKSDSPPAWVWLLLDLRAENTRLRNAVVDLTARL